MIWIALIIGIILVIIFPKQMGILAGVVVLTIAGIYLYFESEENNKERQREAVVISVKYDTTTCTSEYPLLANVKNGSNNTVIKINWNFSAYKPGYSNNVVAYEGYTSEYSTPYESDKILAPNQSFTLCYKAPKLKEEIAATAVTWSVVSKSVVFQR